MDWSFQRVCEDAAAEWSVPALAVGLDAGAEPELLALGCSTDTRFRIASVTKPMVALLALRLLDLESTTGVWPDDVRVRHLLSHTSGFDCELPEPDLSRLGDGDDALARCVAELPSVRRFVAVEEAWSYANTGFWLAGRLAADRAGSTFEDALAGHVLAPAGLESTSFAEPDVPGTGSGALDEAYPRARRPSGGLTSSVGDILRFGRLLLDDQSLRAMRVPHGKPNGGVYGLGLFGERLRGVEVWGHTGSYGGFQCSLLVVPDRNAAFAVLTNSGGGWQAIRRIEDAFFERVLGWPRRVLDTVVLTETARRRFAGAYENTNERYEVEPDGDGLRIAAEGLEVAARPIGDALFEVEHGESAGIRIGFPLEGLGRFGGRLAERVR